MPPRTRTKTETPAAEQEQGDLEYGQYIDKEPTQTHELCAEWLSERTGYDLDLKTVQIVLSLYGKFQRSEENQADIQERRKNAATRKEAAEKKAAEKAEKGEEKPVRRSSRAATEDEGDSAPRRGRGRTAKAAEPAAPPRRTTGRRRPATTDDLDEG